MPYLTETQERHTTREVARDGLRVATMTGAETLTRKSSQRQNLNPGGASRVVTLYAVFASDDQGDWFQFRNTATAAENLTINDSAGSLIVSVLRGEVVTIMVNASGTWVVLESPVTLPTVITDPGNAGAIPVTAAEGTCSLTTAAAETRTLARPVFAGQRLSIAMTVDGGDAVVTVAAAINVAGNTIITFDTAGDSIHLIGMTVAAALVWRVTGNDGTVLS